MVSITSFSPASGYAGDTIQIYGSGFTGATSVTFGGIPAASFIVNNDNIISAVVGSNSLSGSVGVSDGSTSDTYAGFTYSGLNPYRIDGFSPTSAYDGDTVTITGAGFTGATSVKFGGDQYGGGVNASIYTVVNDNQITAIVPVGATNGMIIVTQGFNTPFLAGFTALGTRIAIPTITSFTPSSAAPGALVTITGTNFTGTTAVKFGGVNALVFVIISPTQINAYPNISGTGTISVTNPFGTATASGFNQIIVQVKMPQSPLLNRPAAGTDLIWIWDMVNAVLNSTPISNLPQSTGSSSGGGSEPGNVGTVLGSPFKVRNIDDSYNFDGTDSIITDIRLIGKNDYVVYSTDINAEFDNYEEPTGAQTASFVGTTGAPDGVYSNETAVAITGSGSGSAWYVIIASGVVTTLTQRVGGTGYLVGDTFSLPDLPGIVFTVVTLGGGLGNLVYDEIAGSVTIKNYQLSDNKHVTIYADGTVTTAQQSYILSLQAKTAAYDMALAPILTLGGIVLPWRKAANLIPSGWQECTSFQGKILIGTDPSDIYDATTNPNGLSQVVGTPLGSKTNSLVAGNIPQLTINLGMDSKGGSSGYKVLSTVNHDGLFSVTFGNATPVPFAIIPPVKIVDWIEYIG